METRRVNRPIFRLSKPGQNVRWTTRESPKREIPQRQAIMQKKQELLQDVPLEAPEVSQPENMNDVMAQVAGAAMSPAEMEAMNSLPISSPYHPEALKALREEQLEKLLENATDEETENIDLEFDRRGYKTFR